MSTFDPEPSFEAPAAPRPNQVYISPTLIVTALMFVVLVVLTYLGFRGGSPDPIFLGMLVAIPIGVWFVNRPDLLLITIFLVSSARMWLPWLPGGLPLDVFLRGAFVLLMIGASILHRRPKEGVDPARIFLYIFTVIIIGTIMHRGTGLRELGSSLWGGTDYLYIFIAIAFFLVVPRSLTLTPKQWAIALTFLSLGSLITFSVDLLYFFSGGRFYQLYYIFRPGSEIAEATMAVSENTGGIWRIKNAGTVKFGLFAMLMLPWLWRSLTGKALFVALVLLNLILVAFSGFRMATLNVLLLLMMYFLVSHRKNRLLVFTVFGLAFVGLFIFVTMLAPYMPIPVQRAISWVPMANVSPFVLADASYSTNWRLDIWHETWFKEVPRYWLVGRGAAYHPNQVVEIISNNHWDQINNFIVTGRFHHGTLALLVFYGLFGLISGVLVMFFLLRKHWKIAISATWHNPILKHFYLVMFISLFNTILFFLFLYGDLTNVYPNVLYTAVILELLKYSDTKQHQQKLAKAAPTAVQPALESEAPPWAKAGAPAYSRSR